MSQNTIKTNKYYLVVSWCKATSGPRQASYLCVTPFAIGRNITLF